MKIVSSLRSVVSNVFHRSRAEGEMDEEVRAHIESRAEDLVRAGMPRVDAEQKARIEFGGAGRYKEEIRVAAGTHFAETLLQDARFGLRMLFKSPSFTIIATLTLALGIGANTAIFTVVYSALLRPLPYVQPSRLTTLSEARSEENLTSESRLRFWNTSFPDYLDWIQEAKSFQSLAGFTGDGFTLRGVSEPQIVNAAQATANFFSTLGVKPFLGRDFATGEDLGGPHVKVAILSHGFWKEKFGGDPNVVGRSIQLDDDSVEIVGVLPREFEFAPTGKAELWVPLHMGQGQSSRRSLRWMPVIGRLAPGVTAEQAKAEMAGINAHLATAFPQENGTIHVIMIPLRERIVGQVQPLLLVLFGAVGFVLLIACANVANLLLVRAAGRKKEFAIRAALGASRSRLISQLLAESMMLAAAGGALGYLLAQWGISLLVTAIPDALLNNLPFLRDAHANLAVLAFLCAAAVLTAIAFSIAPALQISSHERTGETLKEETRSSSGGGQRTRLRNALVAAEIAISLVLLVGAGLMVKSLEALIHHNPGFDAQNLLTFSVFLSPVSYPKDPDLVRFDHEFMDRVRGLPGVTGVATNTVIPLTGGGNTIRFVLEGRPVEAGHESESAIRDISAGYFSMMRIPIVAGRFFDDAIDTSTAAQHVIVNQAWVNRFLRGENPLGKRLRFTYSPKETFREIVGVVATTSDAGLDSADEPALYLPSVQDTSRFINYMVRVGGDPARTIPAVQTALHETDQRLFLIQPLSMDQVISQSPSVFLRRYPSYLIGSFAGLALVLAVVGLYGLIAYSVSQRTREMGIRIALGAGQRDLLRLVLGEGARLAIAGIAIGIAAALGLTQLMRDLLFGVSAIDPVTFGGVALALAAVAIGACYVPARRAMRVDPMVALRYE